MRVKAWTSIDFLRSIEKLLVIDYLDERSIQQSRSALDLYNLIKSSEIYIEDSLDKLESYFHLPFFNALRKSGNLKVASEEFKQFKSDPDKYFSEDKKSLAVYLLSSVPNDFQEKSGYHFLTSKDDISILFEDKYETFGKGASKDWNFSKNWFDPHHSIIIADPYIFKEQAFNAISELLKSIASSKLKRPYHVTLIGSDNRKKENLPGINQIKAQINKLESELLRKVNFLKLEFAIVNKEEFHDRIAITNNIMIFSGHGFGIINPHTKSSQRDTNWYGYKPFKQSSVDGSSGVLLLKLMIKEIARLKTMLSKSGENMKNPLFSIIES